MGKVPAFVKVYHSASSQRLPLPLVLCSIFKGAKSGRAFLRNLSGQLWPVIVSRYGDQWFFDDGWAGFVEANHIKVGDVLVFDYIGNSAFDFKLLGGDRCGKKVTWSPSEIEEEEQDDDSYMAFDETDDNDGEESDEEDKDCMEGEEDTDTDDKDKDYMEGEEDTDTDDLEDDEMIIGFEKRKVAKITKRSKAAYGGPSYANKGKSVQVEGGYPTDEDGKPKRGRPSSKCRGSERKSAEPKFKARPRTEEFEDIFQYGIISPPKNPYFVAKLMVKKPSYVQIPADVINDFNLRIPPTLKLLDEQGRIWTAVIKFWDDGRVWIAKGWRAFCKWNHLKGEEDRCICEFVGGNGQQEVQLKVRIVRNRSWLPKADGATTKPSSRD